MVCTINGMIAFANVKRECIGNEICALRRRSFSLETLFCVALQIFWKGFIKTLTTFFSDNIMLWRTREKWKLPRKQLFSLVMLACIKSLLF